MTEKTALTRPHDDVVDDLCGQVFSCLPRSDQRHRGLQYVRGLFHARGRKSIRKIAAAVGGRTSEQSLHHFVAASTWDWRPVRRALAEAVLPTMQPDAWVIHTMVIPKLGVHTVGARRQFVPDLGQVINAQQAIGVWAATDTNSSPVDWRLVLPTMGPGPLGYCSMDMLTEMTADWRLPAHPVVLDGRQSELAPLLADLRAAGNPFLVRVPGSLRLRPQVALPSHAGDVTGHDLMAAQRERRRPVGLDAEAPLVATTRVHDPAGEQDGLTLLATGPHGRRWPQQWWLTDMNDRSPAELVRLSRLIARVDHDFATIADRVGMRDFAGRSYDGWHRHTTLASVAHAAVVLEGTAGPLTAVPAMTACEVR